MNGTEFGRSYLIALGLFTIAVILFSRFTRPEDPRRVLGRGIDRFSHFPDFEFDQAFQEESRAAFFSADGVIAIFLCALVWAVSIRCAPLVERSLLSRGAPQWIAFCASVMPAVVMPLLYSVTSRWLIRRRLDRRFSEDFAK